MAPGQHQLPLEDFQSEMDSVVQFQWLNLHVLRLNNLKDFLSSVLFYFSHINFISNSCSFWCPSLFKVSTQKYDIQKTTVNWTAQEKCHTQLWATKCTLQRMLPFLFLFDNAIKFTKKMCIIRHSWMFHIILPKQGSSNSVLEGRCPAEFSSNLPQHTCLEVWSIQ